MEFTDFVNSIGENDQIKITKHCDVLKECDELNEEDINELLFGLHYLIKYNYIETFDLIFNKKLLKFKTQIINYYNNNTVDYFVIEYDDCEYDNLQCSIFEDMEDKIDEPHLCLLSVCIINERYDFINRLFDYGFKIKISDYSSYYLFDIKNIDIIKKLFPINRYSVFHETTEVINNLCKYLKTNGITDSNEEFCDQLLKYTFIKDTDNKDDPEIIIDNDYYEEDPDSLFISFKKNKDEDDNDCYKTINEIKNMFKNNNYEYNYTNGGGSVTFYFTKK